MLPSRGLIQSSQALRLRQVAPPSRAGCARNFGTAMRSRAGASAPAALVSISQLSGRRVTGPGAARRHTPSSAAAFSLWPFSKPNAALPISDAAAAPTATTTPLPDIAPAAAAAPPPPPPPPSPAFVADPLPPLDASLSAGPSSPDDAAALAQLLDGSALLDMPSDQIGYLHALGLDFGWGPTSMCQWLLEHVHAYTGLPWWASIAAAALLFRAAILMPSLTAAEHSAKLQVLRKNPKYAAAMAEMQASALRGGTAAQGRAMELRAVTRRMQEAANISTWRMFVPMINIPFGYGMFRLMRAMATLPVPGLETGGLLWFTDLTVPDPYFILPLTSAGIMYLIFRTNMKYMPVEQQTTMKWVQLAITPISIVVTIKMSAGLTLFFCISSFLQMLQTWLWHQPWLRQWKGMPPMEVMLKGGATSPSAGGGSASASSAAGAAPAPAARPVSYRLSPDSSWQAPRTVATGVPESDSSSSTSSSAGPTLPPPPSTVDVVKKGWNSMVGTAKEKQGASKDKEAYRKADEYEKKRAMEEEENLYRRREAERRYRTLKRDMAKSEKAEKRQ